MLVRRNELFLKSASEAWFPAIFFSAISKIKHSSHHYRYLVQRLMNKTSWSSVSR